MSSFLVAVPPGLVAGNIFCAQTPDGRQMNVTVPPGVSPGTQLQVQMPSPVQTPPVVQGVQPWKPPGDDAGADADDDADNVGGGDDKVEVIGTVGSTAGLQYFSPEVLQAIPVVQGTVVSSTATITTTNFMLTQLPMEGFDMAVRSRDEAPQPSVAKTEDLSDFTGVLSGVQSFDPSLSTVEELARFFQTHNTKPTLECIVHGYHKKRRTTGSGKNKKTRTVTVTDFRYAFDLNELVSSFGYIQAKPTEQGEPRSLPQVLDGYVGSTNALKEIRMKKHISGFDFDAVRRAFTARIRQLGFRRRVAIHFAIRNNCARVITPTCIAQTANDPLVKCLCMVTCLCIVGVPLKSALGDLHEAIYSNFQVSVNAETWAAANLHRLHCQRGQSQPLGGRGAWDASRQMPPQPTFPAMAPVVASGYGATPDDQPVASGVPLDTNGDGVADSVGFDTTGDGQLDTVVPTNNEMQR
mmetsp:Transcript_25630/g.82238  ORF Transcript_25630/g.82238 Transcript_25630/m.82238 type:complete len:467 (-) Transcript_25630:154-1554(-)